MRPIFKHCITVASILIRGLIIETYSLYTAPRLPPAANPIAKYGVFIFSSVCVWSCEQGEGEGNFVAQVRVCD